MRLAETIKPLVLHAPATVTPSTVTGTAVDTLGYDAIVAALQCGTLIAGGTVVAKLQESDDGSTNWTDITDAALPTLSFAGGHSAQVHLIDLRLGGRANRKRYIRMHIVVATQNAPLAAVAHLYQGKTQPSVLASQRVVV